MRVNFQSVHFTADGKLINFIQDRLDKLELFNNEILNGEVFLKLENASDKENKITEIKLHTPGSELVAKKQAKSFEAATDMAVEALRRQLKRQKEKRRALSS